MSKVITFDDGSVYVERPGSLWGRVNMQNQAIQFSGNEVMVCAVQDVTPPIGVGKGSTIPLNSLEWLKYLNNFHTVPAQRWSETPHMDWCNRGWIGDVRGSTFEMGADPFPVAECVTFPLNVRRVIGETLTHYELWSLPTTERAASYDPQMFNPRNYPWVFALASARAPRPDGGYDVQRVGSGLDVFHLPYRKPNTSHYINKQHFTLFRRCPFTVTYKSAPVIIVDYMFLGMEIFGITIDGNRIPLMAVDGGQYYFPTDWRCPGPFLQVPNYIVA